MSKGEEIPLVNTNDPDQFARLLCHIASLRGKGVYRFKAERVRDQRSLAQNAFYWSVVCPYVAKGLRDAWGEDIDSAGAHEFLKSRFLSVPVYDRRDSEGQCNHSAAPSHANFCPQCGRQLRQELADGIKGYRTMSTTELDKVEFANYLDAIFVFASEALNVSIPEASKFRTEAA